MGDRVWCCVSGSARETIKGRTEEASGGCQLQSQTQPDPMGGLWETTYMPELVQLRERTWRSLFHTSHRLMGTLGWRWKGEQKTSRCFQLSLHLGRHQWPRATLPKSQLLAAEPPEAGGLSLTSGKRDGSESGQSTSNLRHG